MFQIQQKEFGNLMQCILKNENGSTCCSFVPAHGATILKLQLPRQGRSLDIFDGFQNEEQLRANEKSKGIFLLPFPNRIRDGKYFFEGKEYMLPLNKPKENNAIHGFIWQQPFTVGEMKKTAAFAAVTVTNNYSGDYEGFPFPFETSIEYTLSDDSLMIMMSIKNAGMSAMPVGAGWHPYFSFRRKVDILQLQLPQCLQLKTDERMIPTGEKAKFQQFQNMAIIGATEFDTAFEITDKAFQTRLFDPQTKASIIVEQDPVFRYLQVYIPPHRNSIAIEPMTCPANAFNTGDGLKILQPKETLQAWVKVSLV